MEINVKKLKRHKVDKERYRGIYYLFNKGEIVYIGQSNDIYHRIHTHTLDKVFDEFAYYCIMDESIPLDDIEMSEIVKYNPKYNKAVYADKRRNKITKMFNLIRRLGHNIPPLNNNIFCMTDDELKQYIKNNTELEDTTIDTMINCSTADIDRRRGEVGPIYNFNEYYYG